MSLVKTFRDSIYLLTKKPKIFIPNLISAALYTALEIFIYGILFKAMNSILLPPETVSGVTTVDLLVLSSLILFFPIIGAIDIITYAMYPSMVSDHHNRREVRLLKSLKDALSAWKILLSFAVIIFLFLILTFTVVFIFTVISVLLNEMFIICLSFPVLVIALIILMTGIFFVIPIGVIEGEGVVSSLRKSLNMGTRHKKEVTALNVMIIASIIVVLILTNITGTGGAGIQWTIPALILFILSKLVQSIVYTYICTVNPYFYLSRR